MATNIDRQCIHTVKVLSGGVWQEVSQVDFRGGYTIFQRGAYTITCKVNTSSIAGFPASLSVTFKYVHNWTIKSAKAGSTALTVASVSYDTNINNNTSSMSASLIGIPAMGNTTVTIVFTNGSLPDATVSISVAGFSHSGTGSTSGPCNTTCMYKR